jgi:competence protein ComEC
MDPNAVYEDAFELSSSHDYTNPLVISVLSVGQGDATLIIGPNGTTGLIDAGPPYSGLEHILPELRALSINALDWVIVSHYDTDHIGGLLEVLQGEDQTWDTDDDIALIGSVWDRGEAKYETTPWFGDYCDELDMRDYRNTISVGQTFSLGEGAQIKVVAVDGRYIDGSIRHLNPDEENEASIAVLIEYGDFSYLTAGDLTGGGFSGNLDKKDLETKLADLVGPVDVAHLNHHGSRTSTNDNYLDTLNPESAVISLGHDNDFGHPHEEVLERLEARNIEVYRTDNGTIHITTDGNSFEIAPL